MVNSQTRFVRAKVSAFTRSAASTKAIGWTISATERATNDSAMATNIWVTTIKVKSPARASTLGATETLTTASGQMALSMDTVFGKVAQVTVTSANGSRTRRMVTVSTSGPTETVSKVNGNSASVTAKAQTSLQTAMFTSASTHMVKLTAMDSIVGPTVTLTPVFSSKA